MQQVTLLFLLKERQILLALKKRGVGKGKWNGVGGKIMTDETVEMATIRECQEEIGATPRDLKKVAELEFQIPSQQFHNYTHVYLTTSWEGQIQETEEMAPRWFQLDAIPYDQMWSDDKLWLPLVLQGEKLKALFVFDEHEQIVSSELGPLLPPHYLSQDFLTESPKA